MLRILIIFTRIDIFNFFMPYEKISQLSCKRTSIIRIMHWLDYNYIQML